MFHSHRHGHAHLEPVPAGHLGSRLHDVLVMIHSSFALRDRDQFHPTFWASSGRSGSDLWMHRASIDRRVSVHVVMIGVIVVFLRATHPTSTLEAALPNLLVCFLRRQII